MKSRRWNDNEADPSHSTLGQHRRDGGESVPSARIPLRTSAAQSEQSFCLAQLHLKSDSTTIQTGVFARLRSGELSDGLDVEAHGIQWNSSKEPWSKPTSFPHSFPIDLMNPILSPWLGRATAVFACVGCLMLATLGGCDLPQRPPLVPVDEDDIRFESGSQLDVGDGALGAASGNDRTSGSTRRKKNRVVEVLEAPGGDYEGDWEVWEALIYKGTQIGYSHIVATSPPGGDGKEIQYSFDNVMLLKQGLARTLQRVNLTSTENLSGKLIGFESVLQVGPVVTKHNGSVVTQIDGREQLEIETVRGSRRTTRRISWETTFRGLFAVEQSLRAKPLRQKGETRSLVMLLPSHFGIAKVRLTCLGQGYSPLMDGESAFLTEIENQIELDDGTVTTSLLWTDEAGKLVRTLAPALQLNTYRVDEATATRVRQSVTKNVVLPIEGNLHNPQQAKRIAFEISILDRFANLPASQPDPATNSAKQGIVKQKVVEIFPAPGQFVRQVGNKKFQLVVSRSGEQTRAGFESIQLEPSEEDLQNNHFIDFSNTLVRRFADAAVASMKDRSKTEIAMTLAGTLTSLIDYDPNLVGLERASIVARDGKGGQMGQAILLTGLLRAKQIPARIAIGIQYQDDPSRPDYDWMHDCIWVLFYAEDHWVHLDPQTGRVAPPDRIVFTTTTLAGNQQDKVYVPFLNTVTRIKLRAIKAQH